MPTEGVWAGLGLWAGGKSGPPATLVDSLGRGNGLTGGGTSLELGWSRGPWSFAMKGLTNVSPEGRAHWTLFQGHATYRSQGGWLAGLEMEPLVWGYGLNGGYLLGEADRPFPRLRVASPLRARSFFGLPLGEWGFQAFVGRLENGRQPGDNLQEPSHLRRASLGGGEPQNPLLSGYRLEAATEQKAVEFYLNWIVLWGGTRNGRSLLEGYGFSEVLTAMTGTKDPLAETTIDWNAPGDKNPQYRNDARSSTNFDMGIRVKVPFVASLSRAKESWLYLSRGTKGMTISWGVLRHKPLYYLGKDFERDGRNLLGGHGERFWNESKRYLAPNLLTPNDTLGLMIQWPAVRVGLEYQTTVNDVWFQNQGYRSFASDTYPAGFYRYGDPLGTANGGEANTRTLRVEVDFNSRLTGTTWVKSGARPFRDRLDAWLEDHPGKTPTINRFFGLQQSLVWGRPLGWRVEAGFSWQHQNAVDQVAGQGKSGMRWFTDVGFRWAQGRSATRREE